jgi:hypothetical protein
MRTLLVGTLTLLAFSTARADVLVGSPGVNGNCFPFGCPSVPGAAFTQYEQLYSSTDFSSPITISGLTFFQTLVPGGTPSAGTFTLSLSTVSASLATFTSPIAQGADNAQIFSGTLPGVSGGEMTMGGGSFSYNPAAGNLLLDVIISGGSDNGFFLDARSGDAVGIFSRAMNNPAATGNVGWGLVTRFDSVAATPEPTSILLLGTVLVGVGIGLKRKFQSN